MFAFLSALKEIDKIQKSVELIHLRTRQEKNAIVTVAEEFINRWSLDTGYMPEFIQQEMAINSVHVSQVYYMAKLVCQDLTTPDLMEWASIEGRALYCMQRFSLLNDMIISWEERAKSN